MYITLAFTVILKLNDEVSNELFYRGLLSHVFAGGISDEVTPVPIPNTAVKLISAHGTARVTGWESRTSPAFF